MDSNLIRVSPSLAVGHSKSQDNRCYSECQKRSGPGLLKCCPSLEGPNALYGPSKQCCPGSGEIISLGDQCSY